MTASLRRNLEQHFTFITYVPAWLVIGTPCFHCIKIKVEDQQLINGYRHTTDPSQNQMHTYKRKTRGNLKEDKKFILVSLRKCPCCVTMNCFRRDVGAIKRISRDTGAGRIYVSAVMSLL